MRKPGNPGLPRGLRPFEEAARDEKQVYILLGRLEVRRGNARLKKTERIHQHLPPIWSVRKAHRAGAPDLPLSAHPPTTPDFPEL